MVREDIEAGRLVRLDIPEYKGDSYRLQAIYRTGTPPGPAGSWLISRFEAQAAGTAEAADQRSILSTSDNWRKRPARAR